MAGHMPTSSTTPATRSTCTPVIQHGSHVFDIMGYSVHKARGKGSSISSGTFSVGGHDWNIIFCPDNPIYSVADDGGAVVQPCISIHLAFKSKGAKVVATCDLGLVDHTTGLPSSVHRTPEPTEFRYGDASMFFPRATAEAFMDCAQLEASAYLRDDRLTIHCDIAVIKEPRVSTANMFEGRLEAPPSNITEHLAKLLETGEGADVTFMVGGETFVAHKFLLAARSPVFRAELCGPMREAATHHVTVGDMQPDVFRALLHFIYTDSLPPDTDDTIWSYTDNRTIQHLLVAANRYDVDRLKLLCQGILCDNLEAGNVASTLALAYHHNCPKLKHLCFQIITDPNTMEAVKATPGYTDLKTNYPCILADALEFKMRKK